MAPDRGGGKYKASIIPAGSSMSSRRTTPATRKLKDDTPSVYQDMLAEAAVTDPVEQPSRPLKRRKVVPATNTPGSSNLQNGIGKAPASATSEATGDDSLRSNERRQQTIEASSDDSDESDFVFEDVDLAQPTGSSPAPAEEDGIADISISVDLKSTPKRTPNAKRKPASSAEKAYRLLVHKAHLLCLLGHCIYANSWCNDETVHENLDGVLSAKTKLYLRANSRESQFDRNRMFMEGLQQAVEAFKGRFQVTASGMRRARWPSEDDEAVEKVDGELTGRQEMMRASKKMEGSQDVGNQLFCALLRAVGVEARMVCSLQPLPFTTSGSKTSPQKVTKPTIYANASDTDAEKTDASAATDQSVKSSKALSKVPPVRRRLGQPSFATSSAPATPPREKKKPVRKLAYPIFWVEAFNAAHQKWIPVDPIVTSTINKPSKLEPPASYEHNQLSYAFAYEADGAAKDVTRRYAKAYNAKTRRQRAEVTENGTQWWKKVSRFFRRRGEPLDREQVEDAQLAQKEAREGKPANVQDFKDHPYYALERHLRRNEVIHPRREVGKVNAGTAAKPRMEAIFRRQDVYSCRSADKWYRSGREIKEGEQPLKHVVSRRPARRARSPSAEDEEQAAASTTALYAPYQTQLYISPPVLRSRIPRNAFGNLDIYVPSMVPSGGTHIRHPLTSQAAKLLRVDYSDAVTGFSFKGRQGTAIIEGAVVAEQFAEGVRAVIEGLEYEREVEICRARSLQALRLWKRFLTGLRIAERVSQYGDGKGKGKDTAAAEDEVKDGEADVLSFADVGADEAPLLTAGQYSIDELIKPTRTMPKKKRKVEESEEELVDDYTDEDQSNDVKYEGAGGFVEMEATRSLPSRSTGSRRKVVEDDEEDGIDRGVYVPDADADVDDDYHGSDGGFLPDDAEKVESQGGGFLPESAPDTAGSLSGGVLEDAHDTGGFLADQDDEDGEGGGFVADNGDNGEGGGFLPDADEVEEEETAQAPPRISHPNLHAPDNGMDEELIAHHHGISQQSTACVDSVEQPAAQHPSKNTSNPVQQAEDQTTTATDVHNDRAEEGDDSDRGSLLSHDPEDEDAEPDWLESD